MTRTLDDGDAHAASDLLSLEAAERLERLPEETRRHFRELLEACGSELKRELLERALVAGHPIAALRGFAAAVRSLSEQEVLEACSASVLTDGTMEERLRAQADPLWAFSRGRAPSLGPSLWGPQPLSTSAPPSSRREDSVHASEPSVSRIRRGDPHFLGESEEVTGTRSSALGRLAEDLLNEAGRAFGVSFREQVVDGPRLSLPRALESASLALKRGVPVPVILGPTVGEHRRYVLLLQLSQAGKTRAFQLHDPFGKETVWVNETDLLARSELPLSGKGLRRITAMALPRFTSSNRSKE